MNYSSCTLSPFFALLALICCNLSSLSFAAGDGQSVNPSLSFNGTSQCLVDIRREAARKRFATIQSRLFAQLPWDRVPVLGNIHQVDLCTFDQTKQRGFLVHFMLVKSLCKQRAENCKPEEHLNGAPMFSCKAVLLPNEYIFNPEQCLMEQIYENDKSSS